MLTQWAMADRKPLLAVCRGVQVMNVASGGTLFQDLSAQRTGGLKHDYFPAHGRYSRDMIAHDVQLEAGTRLSRIIGADAIRVNSMHHQGIKTLGEGLVANAYAPDGVIEGVETESDQFMVGVQWHPEDLTDGDPLMRKLFDAFIEASAEQGARAALGVPR
jgi:putative glutamine amidotransferase